MTDWWQMRFNLKRRPFDRTYLHPLNPLLEGDRELFTMIGRLQRQMEDLQIWLRKSAGSPDTALVLIDGDCRTGRSSAANYLAYQYAQLLPAPSEPMCVSASESSRAPEDLAQNLFLELFSIFDQTLRSEISPDVFKEVKDLYEAHILDSDQVNKHAYALFFRKMQSILSIKKRALLIVLEDVHNNEQLDFCVDLCKGASVVIVTTQERELSRYVLQRFPDPFSIKLGDLHLDDVNVLIEQRWKTLGGNPPHAFSPDGLKTFFNHECPIEEVVALLTMAFEIYEARGAGGENVSSTVGFPSGKIEAEDLRNALKKLWDTRQLMFRG